MECQHHNLCGDYCQTPAQVAAGLCENCLDAAQMEEAVQLRNSTIVEAATELLDVLDAAANVEEPGAEQREWMERLRSALAV